MMRNAFLVFIMLFSLSAVAMRNDKNCSDHLDKKIMSQVESGAFKLIYYTDGTIAFTGQMALSSQRNAIVETLAKINLLREVAARLALTGEVKLIAMNIDGRFVENGYGFLDRTLFKIDQALTRIFGGPQQPANIVPSVRRDGSTSTVYLLGFNLRGADSSVLQFLKNLDWHGPDFSDLDQNPGAGGQQRLLRPGVDQLITYLESREK